MLPSNTKVTARPFPICRLVSKTVVLVNGGIFRCDSFRNCLLKNYMRWQATSWNSEKIYAWIKAPLLRRFLCGRFLIQSKGDATCDLLNAKRVFEIQKCVTCFKVLMERQSWQSNSEIKLRNQTEEDIFKWQTCHHAVIFAHGLAPYSSSHPHCKEQRSEAILDRPC